MTIPNPTYYCQPIFKIGSTQYEITDGDWNFDPELNKVDSTTSFAPAYTLGNLVFEITIKTKDGVLAALAIKGTEHTDATLTFQKSVIAGPQGVQGYANPAGVLGYKISNSRVTSATKWSAGADKKEAEYTITFQAARKSSDNTDPTITQVVA